LFFYFGREFNEDRNINFLGPLTEHERIGCQEEKWQIIKTFFFGITSYFCCSKENFSFDRGSLISVAQSISLPGQMSLGRKIFVGFLFSKEKSYFFCSKKNYRKKSYHQVFLKEKKF
jgi:hypothetical protein